LIRAGLLGAGIQLSVQAAADVHLHPGDRISLHLDLDQLFVFDPSTGNTLYP
jgi:multiple sugar transport system ATP-binding protein